MLRAGLVDAACRAAPAPRRSPTRRCTATATPSRALLKQGADVNAAQGDGMTALHWAAQNGDAELAQMLLYAGANVQRDDRIGGYTPLLLASQERRRGGDRRRCSRPAPTSNATTTNGTTPLMLAAAAGNADAVSALLDARRRRQRQGSRSRARRR